MRNLRKRTKIGAILCTVIILASIAAAILTPDPPNIRKVTIWLPEDAGMAKGIGSEIYLSGTVVTIPFETYQDLSKDLQDQKVITARETSNVITIHYLGEDESISYHATQVYSSIATIRTETIHIEGNTLEYADSNFWTFDFLIITFGVMAGVIVLGISMKKKKIAKNS